MLVSQAMPQCTAHSAPRPRCQSTSRYCRVLPKYTRICFSFQQLAGIENVSSLGLGALLNEVVIKVPVLVVNLKSKKLALQKNKATTTEIERWGWGRLH